VLLFGIGTNTLSSGGSAVRRTADRVDPQDDIPDAANADYIVLVVIRYSTSAGACRRGFGWNTAVDKCGNLSLVKPWQIPANAEPSPPDSAAPHDALRLVLETALDAVVVMKSDGVVADWNDRAAGVFGWSRDEAVGRTMADLIIPERYREAHRNGLQRYLETGIGSVLGTRIEVAGLRKNGEEFPVELSISPVRDDKSILFVGCLRDITERNALRLARGEVLRVTQRMAMGEMAAAIVHEIKQPSAAVASNANEALRLLAGSAPDLDQVRTALKHIVNDSQRGNEVIDNIRLVFNTDRPILRIKTEIYERSHLIITVEDSGTGIDPKNLDSIFEPFFTTKSDRMGMGLPICWSIIANHGGRMAVAHGQPHGSIFQVFLPRGPSF
jgi:PAS domain S-box-containing protein